MKAALKLLFCLVIFICVAFNAYARSRDFYLDLLGAVDRVALQARLGLDPGVWRSTIGDTEITWILRNSTTARTVLDYDHGLLQRGQIILEDPLIVVLKRKISDQVFCIVYKIKRIDYSDQGYIEPSSELNPQQPSPDCDGRAGRAELQRVASVSDDVQEVFSGRIFRALGKLGTTVECGDDSCVQKEAHKGAGPINRVQLLGTTNLVTLLGGKDIRFPTGGKITTEDGSSLKIMRLDYDVPAGSIDGQIDSATLNITSGQLKTGITELTFAGGGSIKNAGIKFAKASGAVSITGGRMEVKLGPNTILDLIANPLYPSQITLNRAEATFSDLQISFTNTSAELGARYAVIKDIQVGGAILGFSETNSLSIGATQFGAVLGCDEQQPAGDKCLGFSWSAGRPNLVGRISGLNASLRGGSFALSDGGTTNLDPGGTIQADTLYIDTRKPGNPIRGRLTSFSAAISGQQIAIDKDSKINSAKVSLRSEDLRFEEGDKYPIGSVLFDGTATGAVNGTFGSVPFANAKLTFVAKREMRGPVAISSGKLRGEAIVRDGPASANLTVALDNVVFSAGYGSADLSLDIGGAKYTIRIPQEKKPGKNVDWDRKEIVIPLSLIEPISIANQRVVIEATTWKVPAINRTFKVGFSLPDEELLYLLAHKDLGLFEPKCSMKVKYIPDSYVITGQLRLALGGGERALVIDSLDLNKGIAVSPDLGSCDEVVDVACGLVGTAVLGPIGGVAAAMICHRKVGDYVGELSAKFKDITKQRVNSLQFRAAF